MRVLTLQRSVITTRNVTWRRICSYADSSVQANEPVHAEFDIESERGAIDVIVDEDEGERHTRPLDKEAAKMQSSVQSDPSGSESSNSPVSQTGDGEDQTPSPEQSRSGDPPMQDPPQGSSKAAGNVLDPFLARGSQTSVESREGELKRSDIVYPPHSSNV